MNEVTESAQPWMKNDTDLQAKKYLADVEKAKAIANAKGRYKIIADLMAGKEADITQDTEIFAWVNRERMTIEEYMTLHPTDVEDALWEADRIRREMDRAGRAGKDYNPHSLAKWRIPGIMPTCVGHLYREIYTDKDSFKAAYKRFFNSFPAFRISDKKI